MRAGQQSEFERTILPHLKPAYNFARWLTRNEHDAEDVLQEACLRALSAFHTFVRGRDARIWFLTIVRNTCFSSLRRNRSLDQTVSLNEEVFSPVEPRLDPEAELLKQADSAIVRQSLENLPLEYREMLVLREVEELSYKEIAQLMRFRWVP